MIGLEKLDAKVCAAAVTDASICAAFGWERTDASQIRLITNCDMTGLLALI